MSAYDDAVAYLDAEVHPRCDYDIYSDMRDIVDEMESENAKLRELVRHLYVCNQRLWIDNGVCVCALCPYLEYDCEFEQRILDLGIEVKS